MPFSKENLAYTLNGILFVALFAIASLYLAEMPWMAHSGISPLVIAIVIGILYSNTLHHRLPVEWFPGIQFAAKRLLRLAIVLYGFRITFQQIGSVGVEGLALDAIVVASTLFLGTWLGVKVFKLDRHLALLISAGSAICGAAAVLAAEGILKSTPYKATVGVATVVLFGTLAMFLYPILQHAGLFGFDENQFGIFVGASIHEVAQAVVAGNDISVQAGNVAVIVKMTRVMLLVPVLIFLSYYENRVTAQAGQKNKIVIPWFALAFVAVIGFNSLQLLPVVLVNLINQIDIFLLAMAMTAIGMETNLNKIKKVGLKPLYLAAILFIWLVGGVWLLVKYLA
ncbi:YeiH family protein [soil metagenome]